MCSTILKKTNKTSHQETMSVRPTFGDNGLLDLLMVRGFWSATGATKGVRHLPPAVPLYMYECIRYVEVPGSPVLQA